MTKKKNLILIWAVIVLGILIIAGILFYQKNHGNKKVLIENQNQNANQEQVIGGDKDEHGCLIAAGYSWCEAKQKCLRVFEEGCSLEDALRNYLRDNLSTLSPKKEVLGGKFYVVDLKILSSDKAEVVYEDGHIQLQAEFNYRSDENLNITISNFKIITDNQSEAPEDLINEMKKLFIEKYPKNSHEISVQIYNFDENHVRGSVLFGAPGVGEGGIFFAVKIDNKFSLIFDGNGAFRCSVLEQYDFPESMWQGCFEE
ncbi:MAG TPA: hypothetical protein PLK76_03860 [bacterium]|nr:hypothetical protein [bacterium]